MKALVVCPQCGHHSIGQDRDPDEAAKCAQAGLWVHQVQQHGMGPMTPDEWITRTRLMQGQH